MWRPTFDVAARMTRKVQRPPPTEDGARVAAQAHEWLSRWEKHMDNTLSLLYNSAVSRGLTHKLTQNLHALSHRRKTWLHSAYEKPSAPWKPTGEPMQLQPKKRQTDRKESGELAWNMVGEVVRMAEGRDQLMLGRVPLRERKTYRYLK